MYKRKWSLILHYIFTMIILIVIVYLLSSFYFIFKTDEEVSMGLECKKFYNLVKVDMFDVHPPFYYIALKFFLIITTFWTKSMFIKVLFSRLFSCLFLILFLVYIFKIFIIEHVHINYKYQILLFLISPGVINESAKIRMYAISSFILVFQLYELMKFVKSNKYMNLILVIFATVIALYTFYPLGVSAGLFIIIFLIRQICTRHILLGLKLFISGIISLILYAPWIHIILKQIKMHSGIDEDLVPNYFYTIISSITQINAPSPTSPLLKYTCVVSIFVIITYIILFMLIMKRLTKSFCNLLVITLINYMGTLLIVVFLCKRQFRLTTMYPIYAIFISLLIPMAFILIKKRTINLNKLIVIISLLLFTLYSSMALLNNVKNYDLPSVQLVKNFCKWKGSNHKYISINQPSNISTSKKQSNIIGNSTYAIQNYLYLQSINKDAVITGTNKNTGGRFFSGNASKHHDYYTWKFYNDLVPNIIYKK